jgi:uncharacterized protein (DUF2225 family)
MTEKTDKNPKGAGRKKIQLDKEMLGKLAEIQCNDKEIAYVMGVSVDTLHRNYADIIEKGKHMGKIKLRRAMFRNATDNNHAVMQIFLAKNLLGMSDTPVNTDDFKILPWSDDASE